MNNSVNAYAGNGKTYSLTTSLDTRVAIATATQVLGYHQLWSRIYLAFGIELDGNLPTHLKSRDKAKTSTSKTQRSIKGKKSRSERKYDEFNKATKDWENLQVDRIGYESGIAVTPAKKKLPKAKDRNPKGTPKDQLRCPFYHMYCKLLGHQDTRSKHYQMHGNEKKKEREDAKKVIETEVINSEALRLAKQGKKRFLNDLNYPSIFLNKN